MLEPITLKFFGILVTSSEWLIQTSEVLFLLKKPSVNKLLFNFLTFAKPYSLDLDFLTLPPNCFEIIWCPKQIPRTGIFMFSIFLLYDGCLIP